MIKVLGVKANFQIQYQLSFCLWVLTFNPKIAEKLNAYGVIPVLSDILADAQKEKVSRIILAVFRVSVLKFFLYSQVPIKRVYSIIILRLFPYPTRTFSTLLD